MTGGGFSADVERLHRHAGEFPGLSDQVSAVHQELSDSLAAAGDCWGDDAVGQSFAAGHVQAAGDTLAELGALPGRLTEVGDRFTATANAYQQVEQGNAAELSGQD